MTCRLCGAVLSRCLIDLGATPLANGFVIREGGAGRRPDISAAGPGVRPLPARAGGRDTCRRRRIFAADYAYFSSFSAGWVAHARRYAGGR